MEHFAVPEGKAKGKCKDQGEGGKSKGKGKDHLFYKGQGKGVGALEYPDLEPYSSEESWSAEDVAWNPIGAVSKVNTKCIVSGVLPWRKFHQDHAQEEHSSETAANDEGREQDAHHCRGHS